MKLEVYSVYDKAVKAYLRPFYARSRGEALRFFIDACKDQKHEFSSHAEDYVMFYHGVFDDNSGIFVCPSAPERVISALECVALEDRAPREADDPDPGLGASRSEVG